MTLPNYFLADPPPEATLTATMITEACQALRRNRQQYLATRSTSIMISKLCQVAIDWLQPDFPFRKLALDQGPAALRFSQATLTSGLDLFFKQFTPESVRRLIEQDLGDLQRLDAFTSDAQQPRNKRASIAISPELLVHITAGNLPVPALMSMALGLIVRSAQFIKCATGTSLLPRLFAHSIYQADPKLGACLEVAEWRGGNAAVEDALFAQADCLTATGSDEVLASIRPRLPPKARFLGYGQRVSFAYVACAPLSDVSRKAAAGAAADVAAWNQLGCLSPHVIYVQHGSAVSPEQFAQLLADELAARELSEPRGDLPPQIAATISSRRAIYEMRAAASPHSTRVWSSPNSTAWTVVYETDRPEPHLPVNPDPLFQLSCLNRFIYVKEAGHLNQVLHHAENIREKVSTVGLAAPDDKAQELATQLAHWGAKRICPLGQMQNPPLTWRHDGRPSLGDLVTWTDWER